MAEEKISQEQFEEFQQVFNLFDRDGDGRVDNSDLGTILRALDRLPTQAQLTELLAEMPGETFAFADLLGVLTKMPAVDRAILRAELRDAFRVFDKEASGRIAAAELKHIMTSLGEKLSEVEAEEMILLADPMKSGEVDYEQFIQKLVA